MVPNIVAFVVIIFWNLIVIMEMIVGGHGQADVENGKHHRAAIPFPLTFRKDVGLDEVYLCLIQVLCGESAGGDVYLRRRAASARLGGHNVCMLNTAMQARSRMSIALDDSERHD